ELLEGARRAPRSVLGLREDLERGGQLDREDLLLTLERSRVGALLEVGPVAAVLGGDRLARLGVLADDARQVEQLERRLEVDGGRIHRLEEGCRARLRGGRLLGGLLLRLLRLEHLAGGGV